MKSYLDHESKAFIRYLEFPGIEPTAVYLAGLGMAATAVYPRVVVQPGLSAHHTLLVDLFGFGLSDRPAGFPYSLEAHAAVLDSLLAELGANSHILVGHSMGGAVAIELAARRPDLVVQLILAEANLFAGGGTWSKAIAARTESEYVLTVHADDIEQMRQFALSGDPTTALALGMWQAASPTAIHRSAVSLVQGTDPVMWDQLIRMSIPRTFLFGSRSLEEYAEDRELYGRLENRHIRVDVVPEAGHGMMIDNPTGFAAAVSQAIKLA